MCPSQALAKFAMILFVINDMLKDEALAQAGVAKLKQAFAIFAENKQKYPLVYERWSPPYPKMPTSVADVHFV